MGHGHPPIGYQNEGMEGEGSKMKSKGSKGWQNGV